MRPLLGDAPARQHDHPVGLREGRQAVRAEDDRRAAPRRRIGAAGRAQPREQPRLGVDVDGREGVVEDEQAGARRGGGGQGARESDSLALPARHAEAELADLLLRPVREGPQVVVERRQRDRLAHRARLRRGRGDAGRREEDVLAHGAGEEERLLGQQADARGPLGGRECLQGRAVEEDFPGLARQQAGERQGQRALARPDRPGHRHQRPGRDVQRDLLEGRRGVAGIAEGHAAQRHRQRAAADLGGGRERPVEPGEAVGAEGGAGRLARHRERRGEPGAQARVGRPAPLHRVDQLGDAEAAPDEAPVELEEGDERPHRQVARDDPRAAPPDQEHDAGGDQQLVGRLEPGAQARHPEIRRRQVGRQPGDARDRGIGPPEEAQQAEPRELLLDEAGEGGVGLARGGGAAGDAAPGGVAQQEREGRRGEGQQRQAGVEQGHRDDEGEGEEDGVPGLDDELAHPDAEGLDIPDHPRHQVADRDLVQVGQRAGEDAAHGVGAEVGADARVGGHQPPALEDARPLARQRAAEEGQGCPADRRGGRLAPLEGEGGVDRAPQQQGGEDDRRVHRDAGQRAERQRARDLPEVGAQLPEVVRRRGAPRPRAPAAHDSSPRCVSTRRR